MEPTGGHYSYLIMQILLQEGYDLYQVENKAVKDFRERILGTKDRTDFIRRCANGYDPTEEVGSVTAGIINRYAPIATVINDFYTNLRVDSITTPFPVDEIQRVAEAIGFDHCQVIHPSNTCFW